MECKPISTPTDETVTPTEETVTPTEETVTHTEEIATEEAVIVIDGKAHEEEVIVGGRIDEELICIVVP